MKKFVAFLLALAFALPVVAGNPDKVKKGPVDYQGNPIPANEVSLSYGYLTPIDFGMVLADAFMISFSLGYSSMDNIVFSGAVGAGYYRRVNKTFALGGLLAYEHFSYDTKNKEGEITSNTKMENFSLLPSAKIFWFERPHVSMYSRFSAGATVLAANNGSDPEFGFMFHVSPIAIEAGGYNTRGFLELGLGVSGMISGGVKYRF